MPATRQASTRSARKAKTSSTTSSYRGSSCMVSGLPCIWTSTALAPASATRRSDAGSAVSAETSLAMPAPAASAARSTPGWRVSTDTGTPSAASAATAGRMRRHSSASSTSTAPGRVDSPPISTMSAPAAASARPRPIAASGLGPVAAVGEAVGGHVDHAHDEGPPGGESGEAGRLSRARSGPAPGRAPSPPAAVRGRALRASGWGRARAGRSTARTRRASDPRARQPPGRRGGWARPARRPRLRHG